MLSQLILLLDDPSDAPLMTEMYETYKVRLYKYAFTLLRNQYDAEDAVQATWERVAVHFTAAREYYLESQKSFFSYIITIVKNLSTDERKRRGRVTEFPEDWDVPAPDDTEAKSGYDMLIEMIKSMPAGVSKVLELRLIQEYNFKEIGKVLGCSEDAAQKRCSRAMKELEKRMGEE